MNPKSCDLLKIQTKVTTIWGKPQHFGQNLWKSEKKWRQTLFDLNNCAQLKGAKREGKGEAQVRSTNCEIFFTQLCRSASYIFLFNSGLLNPLHKNDQKHIKQPAVAITLFSTIWLLLHVLSSFAQS